ncbi:MAG TPA: carboxymuconolactone decarboxylase family protein [Clostridia bacterium]|nr:carboxymuconolactone decarboxylase family protein [Clostridia bacterium]
MSQRILFHDIARDAIKIMLDMEKYIRSTTIDPKLRELIKIRTSQINGCAHCLDMHTKEAREMGETEKRIYCVSAFKECEFYTDQEKVALELAECITLVSKGGVPDELYNRVREHFDEGQYTDLVLIINQINSWNRLNIAMGSTAK